MLIALLSFRQTVPLAVLGTLRIMMRLMKQMTMTMMMKKQMTTKTTMITV